MPMMIDRPVFPHNSCSMFWNNARSSFENKIVVRDLILLRVVVPVVIYLFISLWISLVTMAFRVSFNQFYGKGGFPIFWGSNFLAMWAVSCSSTASAAFAATFLTAIRCGTARHAHGDCPHLPRTALHRILVRPADCLLTGVIADFSSCPGKVW